MDHGRRLEVLRKVQHLLDDAFRVPGTRFRFGWDPIIGLVPWAGDALTALLSCAIVVQATEMGVPRVVRLRMLMNVGLDLLFGIIPVVGDVADVAWKSNSKNFALLERHSDRMRPPSTGDWVFVIGIIVAVVAMALLPLVVLYWLVVHRAIGNWRIGELVNW